MRARGKYPVKTTLNLAQKERRHRDLGAVIPAAVLLAVAISAFCKFGVLDRLAAVDEAARQADQQTELTAALVQENADYDEVLERYQNVMLAQSTEDGGADPVDSLNLLEQELLHRAKVSSLEVGSDLITVRFAGVTLNEVSAIYARLVQNKLVDGVQVYTAATEQEKNSTVTASMTIRMATETPIESTLPSGGEGAAQ